LIKYISILSAGQSLIDCDDIASNLANANSFEDFIKIKNKTFQNLAKEFSYIEISIATKEVYKRLSTT
jgi:glucose-6-phosphate 1-dehydrogenase